MVIPGCFQHLYEQVDIGLFCPLHIACHTANGDIVEKLFAADSHHIHRHLAGNEFHPVVNGLLAEGLQSVNTLL